MVKPEPVEAPSTMPRLLKWREIVEILLVGAVIGLCTLAVYFILDRYIFTPGLCGGNVNVDPSRCEDKEYFASTLAMIIGGLGGLFALVQRRIFRPLLVVLLVAIGLWGVLLTLLEGSTWWINAMLTSLTFAIAYLTFSWLVQLRNFYLALGISMAVLVLMRLILVG